jgi:zinc protease
VSGGIQKFPREQFSVRITFDTDPDKKDKLLDIAYDEIGRLVDQGPTLENVNKVKGYILKSHKEDSSDQDSAYWATLMTTYFIYGIDLRTNYERTVSSVTPAMVRNFAKRLFSQGNLIEVSMNPDTKPLSSTGRAQ